jgi:UDP-GlcNAc:undecaprenyl-phosphate GlcNAc-1-phosphate transferase
MDRSSYYLLYLFSIVLVGYGTGYFCTRLAIAVATRLRILSYPTSRSSHTEPTPNIGGVGLVVPFLLILVAIHAYGIATNTSRFIAPPLFFYPLLLGGVLSFGVGLIDDIKPLQAVPKLLLQCLCAVIPLGLGLSFKQIVLPYVGSVPLGVWGYLLTAFWMLLMMNAYNFMDGMDGQGGSFAISVGGFTLLIVLGGMGTPALRYILPALLGCAAGFLVFNRSPAQTFMGDCGSQFLGYLCALLALFVSVTTEEHYPFLGFVILLSPFLYDVIFTLFRRMQRRENILRAHRSHLYQRLLIAGFSHAQVLRIVGATFVISGLLAFAYSRSSSDLIRVLLLLACALLLVTYTLLVILIEKQRQKS